MARRDDRAAEGNGLENRRGESYRGFESHSLRWIIPSINNRIWGGARVADWARLLSECRGLNLGRGFESRPPRLTKISDSHLKGDCHLFLFRPRVPKKGIFRIPPSPLMAWSLSLSLESSPCPADSHLLRQAFVLVRERLNKNLYRRAHRERRVL